MERAETADTRPKTGTPNTDNNRETRRSTRRRSSLSTQAAETASPVLAPVKRKRLPSASDMSQNKQKKGEDGMPEPTNAELMKTMVSLMAKVEQLPDRTSMKKMESDLTDRMQQTNRIMKQEITDNKRQIREVRAEMTKYRSDIERLEDKIDRGAVTATHPSSVAATKRLEARIASYMRARRTIRIWPVNKQEGESADIAVRKYFVNALKTPAALAKDVPLDVDRPATLAPARSKIKDEYIVIFADSEGRDAVYSYASGLAPAPDNHGIRPLIPEHLKGSQRILQEYAFAARQSYGKVKWNIKFDDRNSDLMLDIKFPSALTWHNITIAQATEAKRIREEKEIEALRLTSQTSRNTKTGSEKTNALLLNKEITGSNNAPMGGQHETSSLRGASTAQSEIEEDEYQAVSESEDELFEAANE